MSTEARRRNLEIGRQRKKEMAEQKKINKARELLSKYPDRYKIEAIEDLQERVDVIEQVEVAKNVVEGFEEDSDSDGVDMGEVIANHLLKKMKKKPNSKKAKKPKKKVEASESSESSESGDEITGGQSVRRGKVNVNVYNTMPEKKKVDDAPCKLKF